jgi:LysM repeat protein
MDDRGPSDGRDRRPSSRSGDRPSTRRGYAFPRAEHRHPVYGSQAHRDSHQGAYVVGFVVVVLALAGFLYVGLNWATGPGRAAALANPPTPTPIAVVPPPAPAPSPTVGEQTYIVKAGDNPASIAAQFRIKSEELMAANNIDDPQKLQIGQTLKIPPPSSGR